MSQSVTMAYVTIMEKIREERNQGDPDKETQGKAVEDTAVIYNDDLTAAIQLFERKYSLDDVVKAIKTKSPMARRVKDNKALNIYVDEVLENVNKEWLHRADNSFGQAQDIYKRRLDALQMKYKDYSVEHFGLYHDGELALALVHKDGFMPETAELVVRRNTPNKEADESYFASLHDSLMDTGERYKQICDFDENKKLESEADIYRRYAKHYMQKNGLDMLSGSDEQKILEQIYKRLVDGIDKERPDYKTHPERFNALVESQIIPLLRKGIVEASPVYSEPGRDSGQYVTGALAEFQTEFETRKRLSSENYPKTLDGYVQKIQARQERVKTFLAMHDQTFFDGVAAKELIEEHHAPTNIMRAIAEHTKLTKEGVLKLGYPSKEKYAQSMLACAENSIHAEKEIKNLEILPLKPHTPFEKLGVTVKELYQRMMKDKLEAYPSFEFEMAEPRADLDAVEKLLNAFPDTNKFELEAAIMAASPRAKLPGVPNDYGRSIIQQVEKRLDRVQERQKRQDDLQQKFNRLRGLANEGVFENTNPMNMLKDGRIALKMLKQKINKDDIKTYLMALAKTGAIVATTALASKYADQILDLTGEVLHREMAIRDYQKDVQAGAAQRSCADVYMEKMHERYETSGSCQPSMDIATAKELMEDEEYTPEQVKAAVLARSPVAKEPGRDDSYADYVLEQAKLEIERKKERERNYVVVPRLEEREDDVDKEYDYLSTRTKQDLGMEVLSDVLQAAIYGALLLEGFGDAAVMATMNKNAEQGFEDRHSESFGSYIKNVYTKMFTEEQALDNGHTLVRTITNTETTIDTPDGDNGSNA